MVDVCTTSLISSLGYCFLIDPCHSFARHMVCWTTPSLSIIIVIVPKHDEDTKAFPFPSSLVHRHTYWPRLQKMWHSNIFELSYVGTVHPTYLPKVGT